MRTITFYSYKGGVGRSLLVANTAKYLATLGKNVVALDLDLEAPGLHYKFELGSQDQRSHASVGIVDILVDFVETGSLPADLKPYTTEVGVGSETGSIRVMGAGTAPHGEYWRNLSRIKWYDLFYGENPVGTPFFLELQQRILRDFQPDFCLIDSRTGITDMGGVATTLLPSTVVCLALDSVEHLEGLRAVMHGIAQTTARRGSPVTLVPVISRLSPRKDYAVESQNLARIRAFLCAPVREGLSGLEVGEVVALHTERLLESEEQLLIGGKNSPHELPLLRDYLKLFTRIIPAEEIRPHVGQLVQRATSRLLDDPEGAQSDLEALTTYCADEEAYRALLKLYQLRRTALEKTVATAALMWQLRSFDAPPDRLLRDIVRVAYSEPRASDVQKKYANFAEDVWRSGGMEDVRVGLTIANSFLPESRDRAVRLLADYVEKADPPGYEAVVRLLDLLRTSRTIKSALEIVERFKKTAENPGFYVAWARLVVDDNDRARAQEALQDQFFRLPAVRGADPATLYRLLKLAGANTADSMLEEAFSSAMEIGDMSKLTEIGEILVQQGRSDEFESRVRNRAPEENAEEVVQEVRRRTRRLRGFYR